MTDDDSAERMAALSMVPTGRLPEVATISAAHMRSIGFPSARAERISDGTLVVRTEHATAVVLELPAQADATAVEDAMARSAGDGLRICYSSNGFSPGAKALADAERVGLFTFDADFQAVAANKVAEAVVKTADSVPQDRAEAVRLHVELKSVVQELIDGTSHKLSAAGEKVIASVKSGRDKRGGQLALNYLQQAMPLFERAIGNGRGINPTALAQEIAVVEKLLRKACASIGADYDRL